MGNALLRMRFGDTDYRFAIQTVTVLSKQWIGRINSISNLKTTVGEDKTYSASNLSVELNDSKNSFSYIGNLFRDLMTNEISRYIYGAEAELYDSAGISVRVFNVESWNWSIDKFFVTFSDKFGSLSETPVWNEHITEGQYPNANTNSYGKIIPFIAGKISNGIVPDGLLKCYYVNNSATEKYLIGKTSTVIEPYLGVFRVYDENDVDITASCTIVLGVDGLYYIDFATVAEWIKTSIEIPIDTTSEDLLTPIFDLFENEFDLSNIVDVGLNNPFYFKDKLYEPTSSSVIVLWSYIIDKVLSGKEILKEICTNFELDYYVNSENKIVLTFLDINSLTPDKIFQSGEIHNLQMGDSDTTKMKNEIQFSSKYNPFDGSYLSKNVMQNRESINNWGVINSEEIDCKATSTDDYLNINVTPKLRLINNLEPQNDFVAIAPIAKASGLNLFDLIKFSFNSAITNTDRLYQIRGIERNYIDETVRFTLRDKTYLYLLEIDQKILIISNDFDLSEVFFNMAVNGFYTASSSTGAFHSTDIKKHGKSSIRMDGSARINIGAGDLITDVNLYATTVTTKSTLEIWVYFDAVGSLQYVVDSFSTIAHHIEVYLDASDNIIFEFTHTGTPQITLTSTTALLALTFYKFLLVRDGSDWGLYLDGFQEDYVSDATSYTGVGSLFIGGSAPNEMTGYVDDFCANHDNKYELVPNAQLNSMYAVDTEQSGFYKKYIPKNVLVIDSDTVDEDTFFVDSSIIGNNGVITANGGILHSTDVKIQGKSSIEFIAASFQYLSIAVNPKLNLTNQDKFTLSFKFRFNATGNQETIINNYQDANNRWSIRKTTGDKIQFILRFGGVNLINIAGSTTLLIDTVYQITLVRDGADWGVYIIGNQELHASDATLYDINGVFEIGRHATATLYFDGNMNSIRGSHKNVYSAAPVVGLTDEIETDNNFIDTWLNMKDTFLLHSNEVDGSTTFTDSTLIGTPSIITGAGGIAHSTDFKILQSSVIKFIRASNQYLSIPTNVKFDLINKKVFTFDMLIYINADGTTEYLFSNYVDTNNRFDLRKTSADSFRFNVRVGGSNVVNISTSVSAGSFNRITIIKVNDKYGMYLNGVQKVYVEYATAHSLAGTIYLGSQQTTSNLFDGYMTEPSINPTNHFKANPNSDLSDTIAIQERPYGARIPNITEVA